MRRHFPLNVELSDTAMDVLQRLDRKTRERIFKTIRRFARIGHGDLDMMEGEDNLYRLRVGKWRVFFEYLPGGTAVRVLDVRTRGGAYKP